MATDSGVLRNYIEYICQYGLMKNMSEIDYESLDTILILV